jgi:hypothetical protein
MGAITGVMRVEILAGDLQVCGDAGIGGDVETWVEVWQGLTKFMAAVDQKMLITAGVVTSLDPLVHLGIMAAVEFLIEQRRWGEFVRAHVAAVTIETPRTVHVHIVFSGEPFCVKTRRQ